MPLTPFGFTPAGGLADKNSFPTVPANEDAARLQIQTPMNQLRDFVNNTLIPSTTDKTTAGKTYYVSPTGSDANDGLSSGTAFKTIAKAISMIPQIVNHSVTINMSAGVYAESALISGFTGGGFINIVGAAGVQVLSAIVERSKRIFLTDISFYTETSVAVQAYDGGMLHVKNCNISAASSYGGVHVFNQNCIVESTTISNRFDAIYCSGGRVFSDTNGGTGNVTGLNATNAGTIGKNGTQPAGTTAETWTKGGAIR